MSETVIPKIIHYCSFGGSFTIDEAIFSSWKKYCPDYEIICWNEDNFDINSYNYVMEAYVNKKYSFVSDVARLYALKTFGGIYLDTDVELVKNLDEFLNHDLFMGYESDSTIGTALIGSSKGNRIISELLSGYDNLKFVNEDGSFDLTTNVTRITEFINNRENLKDEIRIYPQEYFSPIDYETGRMNRTENTYAVHYFNSSWKSDEEKMRDSLFFKYKRHIPEKLAWNLASYISVMKYRGFIQGHRDMFKLLRRKK